MTTLERKIRRMRRRLDWIGFCQRLVRLLLAALFGVAVYLAVGRFVKLPWTLGEVLPWALAASVPLALLWTLVRRTSLRDASIATDLKTSLRERLSTALLLGRPKSAMEAAVVADAERHALLLRAHTVFPMPVWRELYVMPVPILLIVALATLPDFLSLWHNPKQNPNERALPTQAQADLARHLEEFRRQLEEVTTTTLPATQRDLAASMENLFKDLQSERMTESDARKRLSSMSDRLAEQRQALENQVARVRNLDQFRTNEATQPLADALAKGNFEAAQAELKKIAEKLQSGDLSDAERQKLAEELKRLAQAMQRNQKPQGSKPSGGQQDPKQQKEGSSGQRSSSRSMADMPGMPNLGGMSAGLVSTDDPQANSSGEQSLGQSLERAAASLGQGDLQQALDQLSMSAGEMQSLADSLQQMGELDQISQTLDALSECMSCGGCGKPGCKACMGYAEMLAALGASGQGREGGQNRFSLRTGPWRAGETANRRGTGMGGPGQGMGGRAPFKDGEVDFKSAKLNMQMGKGDIIGVVREWGPQIAGEANVQFESVFEEYNQSAEDTMAREHIPLEYRTLVRDYFDAIRPAKQAAEQPE